MNPLQLPAVTHQRGDRFVFAALLALIAWLPLPWGSHTAWSSHLLSAAAPVLLTLWCMLAAFGRARAPSLRSDLWWPMALWVLWLIWIAVQVAPISETLLRDVSPQALKIQQGARTLPGLSFPYTLSIAPGKTVFGLELSLAYFALYVLVVLTVRGEQRLRWLLSVLAVSGAFQAVYGSMMTLSGSEWGFLQRKTHYLGYATGTFVNRNHLAGYLELTAAMALALVLADLGRGGTRVKSLLAMASNFIELLFSNKFRMRALMVLMAIGLVLTRSRMGNTAFFVSLTVAGLGYVFLRERRYFWRALLLFSSLLIVDVAVVSNWFGLQKVVERLQETGADASTQARLALLQEIPPVLEAYAMTGSGLGTFSDAHEPFRTPEVKMFMDHAHQDYVEFFVETGAIGCGILSLLVGLHVLHALRVIVKRRRRLPVAVCFGSLMAILAISIHSLVDFNLQIPANAATLCVILALCAACAGQPSRKTG